MCDEDQPLVIDNGSCSIKAGYGGAEAPRSVFQSIVGRAKWQASFLAPRSDTYIGGDARAMAGVLVLNYPMEDGVVTNWEDMEKIWHYTFYKALRVDPTEHPVLCTTVAKNEKNDREKMTQMMFETFSFPSFYVSIQSVLSLLSTGRTTGLVIDAGESVTNVVPVYEGYSMPNAIQRVNVGGRRISQYLNRLLMERGDFSFLSHSGKEIVRDMVEETAYVAYDFDTERGCNMDYRLPDGNFITLNRERFCCTEILFKPELMKLAGPGVPDAAWRSIFWCHNDLRRDLCANIVLSGGATMLKGFQKRLEREFRRAPMMYPCNVVGTPDRTYGAWIGGSILASLPTFPQMAITHEEYNEVGPGIVNRKCIM